MSSECSICCEQYNKSTRSKVVCPYCPYECCSGCSERYLLGTTEDAHCMSCRKGWSREILSSNFTVKFISKTYKTRCEELLFEREKSLMPATQPFVEVEKRNRNVQKEITDLKNKLATEQARYLRIYQKPIDYWLEKLDTDDAFEANIHAHLKAEEQRKIISCISIDIGHLEWVSGRLLFMLTGTELEHHKRQFMRACPFADCRGFLSSAWKCGMCDNWACPDCHEVKGKERDAPHVCNPDNVATARLLEKDSRNCPRCAAMIFKISGCDQMYCTQCHTAFSWRTGQIESGIIHNPHYFDMQRRLGTLPRAHGDIPCGGFPDWRIVQSIISATNPDKDLIKNACRTFGHAYHVMIPRYRVNNREENRDLRIKLMLGDITDDIFKTKIQQREKARQRKTDIRQVLDMYCAVLNDLFQTFLNTRDSNVIVNSLLELRSHVNETFTKIGKRWSCKTPTITNNYDIY